jgi:O-acetyl-ADP-ribose deacetylase (regulator of RNase III)
VFPATDPPSHTDPTVVRADIADQRADALVNAAGTSLRMGTGVAGVLLHAANGPIERDAVAQGPVELGAVVVTDAYDLDAEYVIHAAAMRHTGPHRLATPESVREATRNSLEKADELGCASLVIPLLGCGSGGLHTHEGTAVVCDTIRAHEPETLRDVRVIGQSDRQVELLERAVRDADDTTDERN